MQRITMFKDGNWYATNDEGIEVSGYAKEEIVKQLTNMVNEEPDEATKRIREVKEEAENKIKEVEGKAEGEIKEVITPLRSMFRYAPDELVLANYRFIEEWEVGKEYVKGDVLTYEGIPYRIIADKHTSSEQFTPDRTNYIYNDMTGKINPDNPDEIMEFKQPQGYADAYNKGDKVKFEGDIFESKIDGNTWSPAQAPQHWEVLE